MTKNKTNAKSRQSKLAKLSRHEANRLEMIHQRCMFLSGEAWQIARDAETMSGDMYLERFRELTAAVYEVIKVVADRMPVGGGVASDPSVALVAPLSLDCMPA